MARRLVPSVVILAVVLSTCLLAVLPSSPLLAQYDALRWTPVRTPSEEDFLVVNPSEVSALVLGSDQIWYAADIPNLKLYKSEDGGVTWQKDILDNLMKAMPESELPQPALPVWDLAVAPDDPDFIVVVTHGRQEVYVSRDGGGNWEALGAFDAGGLQIADIAISPSINGARDIAVGTRLPDGNVAGDVWIIRDDDTSWEAQGLDKDVSSVAFSPNYANDETFMVVASDDQGTYLFTGYRSNVPPWQVTDPYFIEISEASSGAVPPTTSEYLSPTEDELIYSDIAVPSTYDGDNAARRVVYVSYASIAGLPRDPDDVYRIDDWRVTRMNLRQGTNVQVFSIGHHGGPLIAGEVAADAATGRARVQFCDEPTAFHPDWYEPDKRPSGGFGTGVGNAIVAYTPSGEWAVCGTSTNSVATPADWADTSLPGPWSGNAAGSPDESAISRAARGDDYGIWNQISLIDTDIGILCDYSLWMVGDVDTEPGNIMYLASAGVGIDSIWRSTALRENDIGRRWERVDFLDGPTDDIILRRTPASGSGKAMFYAVKGSALLYRSLDDGQTWDRIIECPEDLSDLTIVSKERIYVLYDNLLAIGQWTKVREWYVWRWTYDIDTGLKSGNTLQFSGNNFIFAGDAGDEGEVAVSTDGGLSFTVLPALPQVGPVHLTLDQDFARNRRLYAATENGMSSVYRWTVGGATEWQSLNTPDTGFTGLAHTSGVLYAAYGEGVDRTLIPGAVNVRVMDWDRLTVGLTSGTDFRADTLRTTVNEMVNIWAIDGRPYDFEGKRGRLWVYADTFALPTPWPVSPALGEVLPCDPCDCEACPFCFEWKPMPKAIKWDLWVALDEQFQHVILQLEDIEPWCCDTPGTCYFEMPLTFDCNSTFYWRVRATGTTEKERVHTRWSPPMHFLVGAGSRVESMHVAPVLVTPEAGATGVNRIPGFSWTGFTATTRYEFQLSTDNAFRSLVARQDLDRTAYVYPGELEWGQTYFWRVRAVEPYPSEWWSASFTVLPQPASQAVQQASVVNLADLDAAGTPFWVWIVIVALFLLVVALLTYIIIERRR